MKKYIYLLGVTAALTSLTSCEDLETLCDLGEEDMVTGQVFVESYNNLAYISQKMDEAYRDSAILASGSGKIDGAEVTRTTDSLIMDYGAIGVVCSDNKVRKGAVRIDISQDYLLPGGALSGKLSNHFVDDEKVDGDILMLNNGDIPGTAFPEIDVTATNLSVEGVATMNGNLKMKWQSGFETQIDVDDAFNVEGNLNGSALESSISFNADIIEDLVYNNACEYLESGILNLGLQGDSVNASYINIDFISSDGCNNLYQLSTDCNGNPISFIYPM